MECMIKGSSHFEYALEHHQSGKLHCHLICAYEPSKVPSTEFFNEKWRQRLTKDAKGKTIIGQIDGRIVNFNRNSSSIKSLKEYISKRENKFKEKSHIIKVDYTQPSIVYPNTDAPKTCSSKKKGKKVTSSHKT